VLVYYRPHPVSTRCPHGAVSRALIVIDVQESFRQREMWQHNSNPDLVGNVNRLLEAARAEGDLVVWILHAEPGSGTVFDPSRGFVRLMDGLDRHDGEPLITKTAHNAFTTTNLGRLLTLNGVRDLLIAGVRTEQCCETTARVASDLGFEVTFVTDATATTPIEHPGIPPGRTVGEILADPLTLSTQDVITRTEYVLAGRFATIRSVADIVRPTDGATPASAAEDQQPRPEASRSDRASLTGASR
jgi:nicotinamidase-related amidase